MMNDVQFGTVKGTFQAVGADGVDAGFAPDVHGDTGLEVLFVPSVRRVTLTGEHVRVVNVEPVQARVNDLGILVCANGGDSVPLMATNGVEGANPESWHWTAVFNRRDWEDVDFTLAPGQTVDLAALTPVPVSPDVVKVADDALWARVQGIATDVEALAVKVEAATSHVLSLERGLKGDKGEPGAPGRDGACLCSGSEKIDAEQDLPHAADVDGAVPQDDQPDHGHGDNVGKGDEKPLHEPDIEFQTSENEAFGAYVNGSQLTHVTIPNAYDEIGALANWDAAVRSFGLRALSPYGRPLPIPDGVPMIDKETRTLSFQGSDGQTLPIPEQWEQQSWVTFALPEFDDITNPEVDNDYFLTISNVTRVEVDGEQSKYAFTIAKKGTSGTSLTDPNVDFIVLAGNLGADGFSSPLFPKPLTVIDTYSDGRIDVELTFFDEFKQQYNGSTNMMDYLQQSYMGFVLLKRRKN